MGYFGLPLAEASYGEYYLLEKFHDRREILPSHDHDRPYVSMVLTGRYLEARGSETIELSAGSVAVHPAGERHENRFQEPVELLALELSSVHASHPAYGDSRVVSGPPLSRIAAVLRHELHHADEVSSIVIEGVVHELTAILLRAGKGVRASAADGSVATRADELIRQRFTEPIALSSIAEDLGVHPSHLSRVFREETGMTIGERIRTRRVELLCRILHFDQPLADLAITAGFSDQSHMTRTFRTAMGMTPAEYRRRIRV